MREKLPFKQLLSRFLKCRRDVSESKNVTQTGRERESNKREESRGEEVYKTVKRVSGQGEEGKRRRLQ